jgi:hypothetical protein
LSRSRDSTHTRKWCAVACVADATRAVRPARSPRTARAGRVRLSTRQVDADAARGDLHGGAQPRATCGGWQLRRICRPRHGAPYQVLHLAATAAGLWRVPVRMIRPTADDPGRLYCDRHSLNWERARWRVDGWSGGEVRNIHCRGTRKSEANAPARGQGSARLEGTSRGDKRRSRTRAAVVALERRARARAHRPGNDCNNVGVCRDNLPAIKLRCHSNNLADAVLVWGVWEALELSGRGTVRSSRQRCMVGSLK